VFLSHVVRPARVLSPKPRFCYLDLCCLIARVCFSVSSLFLFPFRYYLLYLNTLILLLRNIREVEERRVAACFPPTLRARPGSQANAALEGHSHISHSTAAGNPLHLLPCQSPSLPHEHTHALSSTYNVLNCFSSLPLQRYPPCILLEAALRRVKC
jgi:hypothetical protein